MRAFARSLVVAGLVAAAGAGAFGYGHNNSLDGVATAIAPEVAAGDATAEKMQALIEKPSDLLSRDFVTFAKVAALADKNDFQVITEAELAAVFAAMVNQSILDGQEGFLKVAEAIAANPEKAKKIIKQNAVAIAKQSRFLAKYDSYWGDPTDPSKVNLAKAAIAYVALQKLYELLAKKFGTP